MTKNPMSLEAKITLSMKTLTCGLMGIALVGVGVLDNNMLSVKIGIAITMMCVVKMVWMW